MNLQRGIQQVVFLGHSAIRAVAGAMDDLVWLLRDEFTTDQAAPLTSPRTCEPGPGTLTLVQNDGQLSISGGALSFPTQSTAVFGDLGFSSVGSFSRTAGRALLMTITPAVLNRNVVPLAWRSSTGLASNPIFDAAAQAGIYFVDATNRLFIILPSASVQLGDGLWNTSTQALACVLRVSGGAFHIKDGTLLWVSREGTSTPLYVSFSNHGMSGTLDNFRVADLPAPWDTDYGIATDRKAISAPGDQITMTADAIVEHTFVAETGVNKFIFVRRTDGNNRWRISCIQAGTTIDLREQVAGVLTTRATASQTWTNGASYRVVTICEGTTIRVYVNNVLKLTYTLATFNQTATIANVDHAGTDFIAWPRTVTLPSGV